MSLINLGYIIILSCAALSFCGAWFSWDTKYIPPLIGTSGVGFLIILIGILLEINVS